MHAELRLGHGIVCGRSRVERLMAAAGLVGVHRRRRQGCTRRDDTATSAEDLVKRVFGWWAGPSPITCGPSSSATPWTWPCGHDAPTPAPSTTATTAAQYTSSAFGRRLRDAGLLGSMGSVADCYDNAAA